MACAQQAVHRYCLNLRPSGAECPHTRKAVGHVQGWPVPALSRQEEGQYDPHRVDWMDHLLGSTSSRRGSRGFFLQLKQITDSESLFMALQSLTGTFFSPGSPWRARAIRASPRRILVSLVLSDKTRMGKGLTKIGAKAKARPRCLQQSHAACADTPSQLSPTADKRRPSPRLTYYGTVVENQQDGVRTRPLLTRPSIHIDSIRKSWNAVSR